MRRKSLLFILLATLSTAAIAQLKIEGTVTTVRNVPLEGVSVSIKGSYSGTTSDKNGFFSIQLPGVDSVVIQFSILGYKTVEKRLPISQPIVTITILLKEEIAEMKAVSISAGIFEANDKKRATVLKSVDIVTTAGQQADIVAALKTLPGAQQIGEQEGLFVRGGTGAETKVFIDGMMVNNPFFCQCHRAFIVNLDKVVHVEGNAQGYKIKIDGHEELIPVSRSLNNEFSDKLLAFRKQA